MLLPQHGFTRKICKPFLTALLNFDVVFKGCFVSFATFVHDATTDTL